MGSGDFRLGSRPRAPSSRHFQRLRAPQLYARHPGTARLESAACTRGLRDLLPVRLREPIHLTYAEVAESGLLVVTSVKSDRKFHFQRNLVSSPPPPAASFTK